MPPCPHVTVAFTHPSLISTQVNGACGRGGTVHPQMLSCRTCMNVLCSGATYCKAITLEGRDQEQNFENLPPGSRLAWLPVFRNASWLGHLRRRPLKRTLYLSASDQSADMNAGADHLTASSKPMSWTGHFHFKCIAILAPDQNQKVTDVGSFYMCSIIRVSVRKSVQKVGIFALPDRIF